MNSQHRMSRNRWLAATLTGLGVVAIYGWVWLMVDPRLIYQSEPIPFLLDREFAGRFVSYVGGPVQCAAALLTQFCEYSWTGAVVVTALLVCVWLTARTILRRHREEYPKVLPWVPAFLLLVLFNHYLPIVPALAMIVGLAFTAAYLRWKATTSLVRLPVFFAAGTLLCYVVAGPFLLFAVSCGIYELLVARRRVLGAACFLLAGIIPYLLTRWLFEPDLAELYFRWLPFGQIPGLTFVSILLCACLPAACVVLALRAEPAGTTKATDDDASQQAGLATGRRPAATRAAHLTITVTALVLFVLFSISGQRRLSQPKRLHRLVEAGRWEEALAVASQIPEDTRMDPTSAMLARHDAIRALYHAGKLPSEMFCYPQRKGSPDLLLELHQVGLTLRDLPVLLILLRRSDVLFDLGRVNESEHQAHEALSNFGELPIILRRLAIINVLKERPQAARTFLEALKKTLFHEDWATDYLKRLDADPGLAGDRQLKRIRPLMLDTDYPRYPNEWTVEELLHESLDANRHNRMAFEYLMAHYLLTEQLEKFAAELGRLDDFAYDGIPRHYEEAILLHASQIGKRPSAPAGRRIRPETIRRFHEFRRRFDRHRSDRAEARSVLTKDFGDTYWFFFAFAPTAKGARR